MFLRDKFSNLSIILPLSFIALCIGIGFFLIYLQDGQSSSTSLLLRYVAMPFGALLMGFAAANRLYPSLGIPYANSDVRIIRTLWYSIIAYCVIFFTLKSLKSFSLNYELFDAGLYVNKLWRIFNADLSDGIAIALVEGHFQPIIIIYAYVYGFLESPLLPYFLETIFLATGAIPIYLIAKIKTKDEFSSQLIAVIYLLNPMVQFNDILGFHPDHLVLPALLWAFYFADTSRYGKSIVALLILCACSEPWILTASAFGIYLWLGRGKIALGAIVIIGFMAAFLLLMFFVLPHYNSEITGRSVFISGVQQSVYSALFSFEPSIMLKQLFVPKKLFFIFFILFPFLFLPIRSLSVMAVAIPDFLKTLGSTELLHYSVEGHYTLTLIAVMFVGYIDALPRIAEKFGSGCLIRIPIISLCVSLILCIAHSPLPISFDFWSNFSAGSFNYNNYLISSRTHSLKIAERYIGNDPNTKIEISNGAFTPELAKRAIPLMLFPSDKWDKSDYVLLDKDKYRGAGADSIQNEYESKYNNTVSMLPLQFTLLFNDSHIQLWVRTPNKSNGDFR